MIKLLISISLILFISGCASKYKYDYTIHKPKVRFKPSLRALDRLNYETKGHKYVWGAENDGCYDCSGLTYYTYGSMGIEIPRVARDQYKVGTPIPRDQLQKGDLVFFDTSKSRSGRVTHVGIYLGNGKFQHASSSKGRVVISSLNSPYYSNRYLGARRVHNFNNYQRFRPQINNYRYAQNQIEKPKVINYKTYQTEQLVTTPSQVFTNAQKEFSSVSGNYYILIHTQPNRANELITKLKLSGLPSNSIEQGRTILVGPFSSKSEALRVKNFNPELLANATIRSI